MGCICSKSSNDEPTDNPELDPKHHSSDALESTEPKHDHKLTADAENEEHGSRRWSLEENKLIVERCSSFHTVEEYDEMLRRINSSKDDDDDGDAVRAPAPVPVPDVDLVQPVTDSSGKQDGDGESGIKENKTEDIEFQTVASLRQWLHSPHEAEANAKAVPENPTPKIAFGFYDDNTTTLVENLVLVETSKKQEDETIIELVVAFDQYMQQLQIEEDNILKHIHNITE